MVAACRITPKVVPPCRRGSRRRAGASALASVTLRAARGTPECGLAAAPTSNQGIIMHRRDFLAASASALALANGLPLRAPDTPPADIDAVEPPPFVPGAARE